MASDPINLRGIVLHARDYKEKDKVISFLSKVFSFAMRNMV